MNHQPRPIIEVSPQPDADNPAMTPPASRLRFGKRHFLWTWLVLAVVAAAIAIPYRVLAEGKPAEVVRAFLEAAQAGDADQAETFADFDIGSHVDTTFMETGDNGEWTIVDVSTLTESAPGEDYVATVSAIIADSDGAELENVFTVAESNEDLVVVDGLSEIRIVGGSLSYVEVNGEYLDLERGGGVEFVFLPGVYEFYAEPIELAEIDTEQWMLLGDRNVTPHLDEVTDLTSFEPEVRPTSDMEAKVEEQFDLMMQECVSANEAHLGGCPVSAEDYLEESPVEWELSQQPDVAVSQAAEVRSELALSLRTPGVALARGTFAVDEGTGEGEFACLIDPAGIDVLVTETGDLYLGPLQFPDGAQRTALAPPNFTCTVT